MKYILLVFFIILYGSTFCQTKVEKEFRVDQSEVPTLAITWIESTFNPVTDLKWYYEETSGVQSFEAKFKIDRDQFSVEFDTLGELEDFEILISEMEVFSLIRTLSLYLVS